MIAAVLKTALETFYPGYFALVMSTGIISTGCEQLHYEWLGTALFTLNKVQYVVLLILLIARLVLYSQDFKTDLATHSKGAGFLTLVAGSCILGTEYVQGKQMFSHGAALGFLADCLPHHHLRLFRRNHS